MKSKRNLNIIDIVLLLLSVINILEFFLPRIAEENSNVRLPLQLLNLLVSFIMFYFILINNKKWKDNSMTISVKILIALVLVYFFYYFLISDDFIIAEIIPYVRFLTWLFTIIFFYNYLLRYGISPFFFKLFVLTFVITTTKQIFDTALFESEKLNGGDTAALPLLFIIPISLLIFKKQMKIIVILFCSIMIIISLRRTAIVTLLLCIPFFYSYVRKELKSTQVFIFIAIVTLVGAQLWSIFGDLVFIRFAELSEGGEDGSYGSGRSSFYLIVWDGWLQGDVSLLLGNGLTSVRHLFMRKASIDLDHAHNDWLEILYTFGFFGILIWGYFIKAFWSLKKRLSIASPRNINVFYIVFISFMVISISSGCVLRISTISMSICISLLMYFSSGKKMITN